MSAGISKTEGLKLKATEVADAVVNILSFPQHINVSGINIIICIQFN